jgi:hypothetical protein
VDFLLRTDAPPDSVVLERGNARILLSWRDLVTEIDRFDMDRFDIGREFPAKFFLCGPLGAGGFGPVVRETLPAIIAHEFLGHAWAHAAGLDSYDEGIARRAENLYATTFGRRERCGG